MKKTLIKRKIGKRTMINKKKVQKSKTNRKTKTNLKNKKKYIGMIGGSGRPKINLKQTLTPEQIQQLVDYIVDQRKREHAAAEEKKEKEDPEHAVSELAEGMSSLNTGGDAQAKEEPRGAAASRRGELEPPRALQRKPKPPQGRPFDELMAIIINDHAEGSKFEAAGNTAWTPPITEQVYNTMRKTIVSLLNDAGEKETEKEAESLSFSDFANKWRDIRKDFKTQRKDEAERSKVSAEAVWSLEGPGGILAVKTFELRRKIQDMDPGPEKDAAEEKLQDMVNQEAAMAEQVQKDQKAVQDAQNLRKKAFGK